MVPEEKKMGKKSVAICKDEKELFDITLVGFSPCISCFVFFVYLFLSFFLWLLFLFFLSKSIPIRRGFSYFLSSCFCFAPFPPFFIIISFSSPQSSYPHPPFPLYLLFFFPYFHETGGAATSICSSSFSPIFLLFSSFYYS